MPLIFYLCSRWSNRLKAHSLFITHHTHTFLTHPRTLIVPDMPLTVSHRSHSTYDVMPPVCNTHSSLSSLQYGSLNRSEICWTPTSWILLALKFSSFRHQEVATASAKTAQLFLVREHQLKLQWNIRRRISTYSVYWTHTTVHIHRHTQTKDTLCSNQHRQHLCTSTVAQHASHLYCISMAMSTAVVDF